MKLSDRQLQILRAVVEEYRASGLPVGSRVLARRGGLELSAATIRNEMADMEAMGYLEKPHASAGRMPTQEGYRLYVDAMIGENRPLSEDELRTMTDRFRSVFSETGEVCTAGVDVISRLTGYIGVAVSPSLGETILRRIQLVRVGRVWSVAVLVMDTGAVIKEKLSVAESLTDAELERISDHITGDVAGLRVKDACRQIEDMGRDAKNTHKPVMRELYTAINRNRNAVETFLGGRDNMWEYPEYQNWRAARRLESLLNTRDRLLRLLGRASDMEFKVSIGAEAAGPDLPDLGVVTSGYTAGDANAVFGVIGPTRMNYPRVLSVLRSVGQCMSGALGREKTTED